jgi:PTH1 family peptidyl-tRNA hydrolase
MNRSGRAAAALCSRYEAEASDFVVVCDDADLGLGRVRIRGGGRAGGHNGLRSLIDAFGTEEFARVKLGVRGRGRDERELADYVLEPFEPDEGPRVEQLVDLGVRAVLGVLENGLADAMNRYNGLSVDDEKTPEG